jgi:hypothetical protein
MPLHPSLNRDGTKRLGYAPFRRNELPELPTACQEFDEYLPKYLAALEDDQAKTALVRKVEEEIRHEARAYKEDAAQAIMEGKTPRKDKRESLNKRHEVALADADVAHEVLNRRGAELQEIVDRNRVEWKAAEYQLRDEYLHDLLETLEELERRNAQTIETNARINWLTPKRAGVPGRLKGSTTLDPKDIAAMRAAVENAIDREPVHFLASREFKKWQAGQEAVDVDGKTVGPDVRPQKVKLTQSPQGALRDSPVGMVRDRL